MTINILFAAKYERWSTYEPHLRRALEAKEIDFNLGLEHSPQDVDYIIYAPNSDVQDFTPYTKCKAVLNLWAGVEAVVNNPTLTMPLARMVDHGLTQGMSDWVCGHTLRHHLGMDAHIHGQDGKWREGIVPPLAQDRVVTILGLGALGATCADRLSYLGFNVRGWSRSPKDLPNIDCYSGEDGLKAALHNSEIVILLLPDTPATENTLNSETLGYLKQGACIINPGRGPLIDDDALLASLNSGQLSHATLDVFRIEPLPQDHPFWAHPKVTVTPHIASETRPQTAAEIIVENIHRGEQGLEFLHLVDRSAGY